MKTQYYVASSLDGFIATADDSLDWLFPLARLEDTSYPSFFKDVGAIAMGATTYNFILKQMAAGRTDQQRKWPYPQPTWVFSYHKLSIHPGDGITLCKGDVHEVHAEMKAACKNKNIWIMGGGEIAGQFFDAGLIDELIVQIGSAVLKEGKPFLPRSISFPTLSLISAKSFGPGMAELRYTVKK